MNKYKDIHTQWLADELKRRGHELLKETKNKKNPRYTVFVFRNTIEFDRDLTAINQVRRNQHAI